jgi:hypothetical protein
MSTLPPNHRQDSFMSASSPVNMATKTKPAACKAATAAHASANATSKQKSQMHRRSRTGLSASFLRVPPRLTRPRPGFVFSFRLVMPSPRNLQKLTWPQSRMLHM